MNSELQKAARYFLRHPLLSKKAKESFSYFLDEVLRIDASGATYQDTGESSAIAAIQFALDSDEGLEFLRLWNEGEFEAILREWPECPHGKIMRAEKGKRYEILTHQERMYQKYRKNIYEAEQADGRGNVAAFKVVNGHGSST